MSSEFEIRLVGGATPDGEIKLGDLAAIAGSLQELSLRLGRSLADQDGPGRTKRTVEELAQLRLRSVAPGSTRLDIARGVSYELDLHLPEVQRLNEQFWEIITSISHDERPDWVSDLVADSAAELVQAFRSAAPKIEVICQGRTPVRIDTRKIHQETWTTERRKSGRDRLVVGRLEKVDLRSHNFRIRDDMGNAFELESVRDAETTGKLVGAYVRATGRESLNRAGAFVGLGEARIEPDDSAATNLRLADATPLSAILASAPGPDPAGAIELSDEEFAAFLEAI